MRNQVAHHGQLQNRLLELVDALFGDEQGVEVGGEAGPVVGQFVGVFGLCEGAEQGVHEGFVGLELVAGLLFQPVAEGQEFIHFLDDALLFFHRRDRDVKHWYRPQVELVCMATPSLNLIHLLEYKWRV
eukprot:TRINITY_DN1158_c0_g3_i1.p6 TRINITY_DN1158_c0_g3~~TRINITY_DN1158_c0_g3_i1.p6  ORF type:complete len:129 (+),score=17.19 TRINITY_DN1158_c0_g3_i1:4213-4599(+)